MTTGPWHSGTMCVLKVRKLKPLQATVRFLLNIFFLWLFHVGGWRLYGSRAGTAVRVPVLLWRRKGPGQPRQRQARTHGSRDGPLGCWMLPCLDGLLPFMERSAAGSSSGVTVPITGSASGPSGALEVSWLLSFLTCLVETSHPAVWALPPWGGVGPGRTSPPGEAGLCGSSATCC